MDLTHRKWWLAGAGLAAALLVAGLVWRFSGDARPAPPPRAAVEQQLDALTAADPYLTALRRWFPDDYARLRQEMLADLANARTIDEVQTRAAQRVRDEAGRTAAYVAAAPDIDLTEVVAAERAVVRRLQQEDERLCAQFGISGLPPGTKTSAETAGLLAQAAEARVKAARDGLDTPVERKPPSDADLKALRAQMLKTGADEALVDLILSPAARSASQRDQCAGSVAFYDALAALPPDAAARWLSAITAQSAAKPSAPAREAKPAPADR